MMRWVSLDPVPVPDELYEFVGGHPLVAQQLARRGILTAEAAQAFLDPTYYTPAPPSDLPDLDRAAERLRQAIVNRERILVWGDFDVDGQTATALLYTALRDLGAHVIYHVPVRDTEGHGINLPKLQEWIARGIDVLLTCDTGITAFEAVEAAQSAGVSVIITDHHALGDALPDAFAVVNPMRLETGHPLYTLPGVGVAYKLIEQLAAGRPTDHLLDLVALGIVADVMEQINDTRYLLQRGLDALRFTERPGLQQLIARAEVHPTELNETDIGFALAPRLNAQGRLADARDSVELLSTDSLPQAAMLANQLEAMNARRKLLTRFVYDAAQHIIERDPSLLEYAALVISHPEWQGGIVGIVASRLAEDYHRPVLLFTEKGAIVSGSARSIPGCNITEALKQHKDLLLSFGGHAMAAGMRLRKEDLPEFRRRISRTVREMLAGQEREPTLMIDAELPLRAVTLQLAQDIARLAPFGNGNPPLTFASRGLHLAQARALGRSAEHLELLVEDETGETRRALWWNAGDKRLPSGHFDLAYTLRISRFRGEPEAQIEVLDLLPLEEEIDITAEPPRHEILDLRGAPDPLAVLNDLVAQYPDALIWREGTASGTPTGVNRYSLRPADTLIIWTIPPGGEEWRAALEIVQPRLIVLIGAEGDEVFAEAVLKQLIGLIKYVVKARGGQTTLADLAAALALPETAAWAALQVLASGGQIMVSRDGGTVHITLNESGEPRMLDPKRERELRLLLDEVNAYRQFWRRQRF